MWFKQAKLFQLSDSFRFTKESLIQKLEQLVFQPCPPSMWKSVGWISPIDEENASLAHSVNGCTMICLQIEEKILPTAVINHEVRNRVKQIETLENRKVYQKEKRALKDDVTAVLLPRAFSRLIQIHAYLDARNHWLIIDNVNDKKVEQFISLFNRTFDEKVQAIEIDKPSTIMTQWLLRQNYSSSLAIEKTCVLQDAKQQNRIIRCQQQDLFSNSIQLLLKDGCEVKKIALTWQDCMTFSILDNFSLQSIKFQDKVIAHSNEMEPESKLQQLHANFMIMSELFANLFKELLKEFSVKTATPSVTVTTTTETAMAS